MKVENRYYESVQIKLIAYRIYFPQVNPCQKN